MNNNLYVKHLVECQCILSIFKNKTKPIYHKIPVFSLIDENDMIKEKYIICESCGIVHFIFETFKSEIKWGQEEVKSLVTTKEDVKFNLESYGKKNIIDILEKFDKHISDWEYAEFLVENDISGFIVLEKNESDNNIVYKILEIADNRIKIKKEISQRYL